MLMQKNTNLTHSIYLIIIIMLLSKDFGTLSDCANTALPFGTNTLAETYGPGSRCMEAGSWTRTVILSGQTTTNTFFRSGCYEVCVVNPFDN